MKHITSVLCAGLASLVLLSSAAHAQNGGLKFSLIDLHKDLKTYSSATESTAYSINNRGEIAGNIRVKGEQQCFYSPTSGKPQAFYLKTGSEQRCDARAIDAKGNVAGTVWTNLQVNRAFRRDTNRTLSTLDPASLGDSSFGLGIYNARVVGYTSGSSARAVKWDSTGALTTLFPYLESVATGINSSNLIVGSYHWFGLVLGFSLSNGTLSTLATLGGNTSLATAVNANGYIIGTAENAAGCWDVAVWFNTVAQDLGNCWGWPLAISSDNWIVGYNQIAGNPCENWGSYGNCTAFLSTMVPSCAPVDLNTLLDSTGAGWVLKEATGINDAHQIVGYGVAPNGEHHAFLLTPNDKQLCFPE